MAKVDKSKGSISWVNDFAMDIERFGEDKLARVETDEELKRLAEVLEHFERCYAKYKGEEFDMEGSKTEEEYRYYLEESLMMNTKGVLKSVEGRYLSMADAFKAGELDPAMFPDPYAIEKEKVEDTKIDSVPTAGMPKTFEFEGKEYKIQISAYKTCPMGMAIQIVSADGEPFDHMTRNLGSNYYTNPDATLGACARGDSFIQFGCAFINGVTLGDKHKDMYNKVIEVLGGEPYTRWGEAVSWKGGINPYTLWGDGIGADGTWYTASGDKTVGEVTYPLYQFDRRKLEEYDPKGFAEYQQSWFEQMAKEQEAGNKILSGEYGMEDDDDFGDE